MRRKAVAVTAVVLVALLSLIAFGGARYMRRQSDGEVKVVSKVKSLVVVESHVEHDAEGKPAYVVITLRNKSPRTLLAVALDSQVQPGFSTHQVKSPIDNSTGADIPLAPPGGTFEIHYPSSNYGDEVVVSAAAFDDGSEEAASPAARANLRDARAKLRAESERKRGRAK